MVNRKTAGANTTYYRYGYGWNSNYKKYQLNVVLTPLPVAKSQLAFIKNKINS